MSIDKTYIEAAIETLDLINQLINYLHENQQTDKIPEYLSQIQTKADARISSTLGVSLGIKIPVDQEGKPTKYWEGVRDTAKLGKKQWITSQDLQKFIVFHTSTRSSLAKRIGVEDSSVNPLEGLVADTPIPEVVKTPEPVNPLEEMLGSEPESTVPEPTPVVPTPVAPTPAPVQPKFEPVVPEPTPVVPTPVVPTPVAPTPEPVQPKFEPAVPEQAIQPSTDKLSALDEPLKSSGLEDTPQTPSLSDMLIEKDMSGEKEEDDDMLSLSLREALKILRDEDED